MSKDEFFAFMPLLIYGLAIGELIMHWRDYLKEDRRYWPHIITGLVLLELAFLNFYYLYDELDLLFETYISFLARMLTPILFLLLVSVFTPEDGKDVKKYFNDKMPTIFTLLALFIISHSINDFAFDAINIVRFTIASICVLIAVSKKIQFIWLFIAIRWGLFLYNTYVENIFN